MTAKIFDTAKMTDEQIESHLNTAPGSDPSDAAVSSISGETAEPEPLLPQTAQVTQEEFERMREERDQLIDRLARLQAEFDNARKREVRERAEFRDFAQAGAVERFLSVLDNFQLAFKSNGTAEQLRAGVDLILKQMEEALRSLQVVPVESVGATFDPRVHEAIDSVERTDLPDQQILEEVRRGYRIKDRLLRPALVRVVSNPKQKEA